MAQRNAKGIKSYGRILNGSHLSAEQRGKLKRSLLREGWYQNALLKWEHPRIKARINHRGYTLYGACVRQGLIPRP